VHCQSLGLTCLQITTGARTTLLSVHLRVQDASCSCTEQTQALVARCRATPPLLPLFAVHSCCCCCTPGCPHRWVCFSAQSCACPSWRLAASAVLLSMVGCLRALLWLLQHWLGPTPGTAAACMLPELPRSSSLSCHCKFTCQLQQVGNLQVSAGHQLAVLCAKVS
jgi:hypothetical protein